jgi:hypothetical protein
MLHVYDNLYVHSGRINHIKKSGSGREFGLVRMCLRHPAYFGLKRRD